MTEDEKLIHRLMCGLEKAAFSYDEDSPECWSCCRDREICAWCSRCPECGHDGCYAGKVLAEAKERLRNAT